MLEFLEKYKKWIKTITKKGFGNNFYLRIYFIDLWDNSDMEIPLFEDIPGMKEEYEYSWTLFEEVYKND